LCLFGAFAGILFIKSIGFHGYRKLIYLFLFKIVTRTVSNALNADHIDDDALIGMSIPLEKSQPISSRLRVMDLRVAALKPENEFSLFAKPRNRDILHDPILEVSTPSSHPSSSSPTTILPAIASAKIDNVTLKIWVPLIILSVIFIFSVVYSQQSRGTTSEDPLSEGTSSSQENGQGRPSIAEMTRPSSVKVATENPLHPEIQI
jgi:hypothetical protein